MNQILNLTQHATTPIQAAAGVVEPSNKKQVKQLLTFYHPPTKQEMIERANKLADLAIAEGFTTVMIAGASYFMAILPYVMIERGLHPVFSFSPRQAIERHHEDGSMETYYISQHEDFVTLDN